MEIQLKDHIVNRLLTDKKFWVEMVMSQKDDDVRRGRDLPEETYLGVVDLLHNRDNKTYVVTRTVMDRLELFDTKKAMDIEGWNVFKNIPDFKKTFIFPTGHQCLRVWKTNGLLYFYHLSFEHLPKVQRTPKCDGSTYSIVLFVDLAEGRLAEYFNSEDGVKLAPMLYALMCFTELCDNEVIEIEPKAKYTGSKSDKFINSTPWPIAVINNTWNVTTIRTEGFAVRGHAALRYTGSGRTIPKMVYIEPYQKNGYTRRSGKEVHN